MNIAETEITANALQSVSDNEWASAVEITTGLKEPAKTVNITVYASSTGLFTEGECEQDNLTEIEVSITALEKWVEENRIYGVFSSVQNFLNTYTADSADRLVYWLMDNGYDILVYGRPIYKYGMRIRGFSIGSQPEDGLMYRQDDKSGKYHDIIVYNRALSEQETKNYSLDFLEKKEGSL